ncbi:tripartite tricarboxylate transporter substrate binding protein [Paralcaligenes sp. KSB-10]|uniref:Bug family tripartite tricarboxylate transporter substrate binding protein n=1 Tax=Paralcaligenes sp. KSB-10 TaxID=2901142 RepID=UPI001E4E801B|nr:tripartite tricarboxylate transporter substrate binding protein [Paralcaligenes sp. KSB-10]UHL62955.1 tripartite tricarboxylate transporter substrate binding protein [Paralcaligenes sp. KSB-10]
MLLRMILLLGCLLSVPILGYAQDAYPSRSIQMVVPFSAGGPSDLIARLVAHGMSERLKQSIVIQNKTGAGGVSGTNFAAKAEPDGYTILLATIAYTTSPYLYKTLPYDPEKDLVPVGLIGRAPLVLVVRPTLKVDNARDLIKLLKSAPGKYSFGSSGVGSIDHLAGALFESQTGVKALHVPYRGAAPAIQDLLAGRVDFMITTNFPLLPYIHNGKLKALAIASSERLPQIPDVPTMAQAGVPDFEVSAWYSILAPAGVPKQVIGKLNKAMVAALADPELKKSFQGLGATIAVDQSPAQLATFITAELHRWKKAIDTAGVEKQ